ncbi:hypothetical protein [Peredibacter starrii]|uniref:Uncharacterized protein n=1 Tax=Peredibacter starrii TaxID=28202 RepID=A0AAX4HMJ4_9BACT|nr:hypothetical protein [Peredibacter starrii]WPU64567.1 hypothetical protein SOO65_17885 [Peredibacter starrii]
MKILFACCFLLSSGLVLATPNLIKCQGGESSGVSERWCKNDQWLVSLENAEPFIAKIKKTYTHSRDQHYEIIPKDSVSYEQRRLIGKYLVKFDQTVGPLLEKRFPKGFLYDLPDLEDSI